MGKRFFLAAVAVLAGTMTVMTVNAYSAPAGGGVNGLGGFTAPSLPSGDILGTAFRSAFQQFDLWLYGVAGFHILNLLDAALGVFLWLLGAVKGNVDWLIRALR